MTDDDEVEVTWVSESGKVLGVSMFSHQQWTVMERAAAAQGLTIEAWIVDAIRHALADIASATPVTIVEE